MYLSPFCFQLSPYKMVSIEQITPRLTWRLRRDVLYPDHQLPEMEMEEDANGIHFGAFKDNRLVGVVSLFQHGEKFQFRKLAIDPSVQNIGIGSSLLAYITTYAQENSGTLIWCNARLSAIGFYIKSGYSETGKQFSKKGIEYEIMEKLIIPSSGH